MPLDQDSRAVVAALTAAHRSSRLSQGAFAEALGTSASRWSTYVNGSTSPSAHFVARATRIGSALGAAAARRLLTPPAAAALLGSHLSDCSADWAWRALLQCRDHLSVAVAPPADGDGDGDGDGAEMASAWEARPRPTGSPEWDVLLAAVLARAHEDLGLAAPAWTRAARLPQPWAPPHPFLSPDRVRQLTPGWLAEVNVFVPGRDLVTA